MLTSVFAMPAGVARPTWRDVVEAVADRLHAAGDDVARAEGWTVRRVGLTGRRYRSPLFDTRGPAFADMRRGAGLTIEAVADRADVSVSTVDAFEAGGPVSAGTYWRLITAGVAR